jgi:gliding motility-associated-like protein
VVVHVSGANTYLWDNGLSCDSLTISREGTYSVNGTSKTGCTGVLKFNATYCDLFDYSIQKDPTEIAPQGTTVKLWSEEIPSSQYYWDFGDGSKGSGNNLTHSYAPERDSYFDVILKIINPNGCEQLVNQRIWVAGPEAPNTFTPNDDGKNDIFMKDYHLKVYNRNGILMSDNIGWDGYCWNGTYKGKPAANDTYFYVVYYLTDSGTRTKTGYVTLIR